MKKALMVACLVIFIISQNLASASASTFSARIERDAIDVQISSTLSQNITSLFERRISLSGDPLINVTRALEKQIKAKSPEATVRDISANCIFTNTTVEVSVRFKVLGVVSRREEFVTANLTWRALNILDDFSVENVSYNLVGKAYFRGIIPRFENMTGAQFYENRTIPVTTYRAKDVAGNITMLRFKSLEAPLMNWQMAYNITKGDTCYRLKLGRVVDLAVKREVNASVTELGVWMDLSGEIATPGFAKLKGDSIMSETGVGTSQVLMLVSVVVPLLIAFTARIIERKRIRTRTEVKRR